MNHKPTLQSLGWGGSEPETPASEHHDNTPRKGGGKTESVPKTKARKSLIIQIDDRDFQRMQDETSAVFAFWYCLQRLAYRKGNPFTVSFDVLRRETGMTNKQISTRTLILEGFEMLDVKRGKTSRTMNEYKLLSGMYKDHVRKEIEKANEQEPNP